MRPYVADDDVKADHGRDHGTLDVVQHTVRSHHGDDQDLHHNSLILAYRRTPYVTLQAGRGGTEEGTICDIADHKWPCRISSAQ